MLLPISLFEHDRLWMNEESSKQLKTEQYTGHSTQTEQQPWLTVLAKRAPSGRGPPFPLSITLLLISA